jgi:hypothetical protein
MKKLPPPGTGLTPLVGSSDAEDRDLAMCPPEVDVE